MSQSSAPRFSMYDDPVLMQQNVARGEHRGIIGGMWDELGTLQAEFLKSQGLLPQHTLIDIGAGSFRAGVKLVPYLDPGNYYAIDLQEVLLEAGYAREIVPTGLADRFPRSNLAATADFDLSGFHRHFDFGVAQSVFTHMPIRRLGDCLAAAAPHFNTGGKLFVTLFFAPDATADRPFQQLPGGVITTPARDPYHVTLTALLSLASEVHAWRMSVIGDWAHPRNQQMVCFVRRA